MGSICHKDVVRLLNHDVKPQAEKNERDEKSHDEARKTRCDGTPQLPSVRSAVIHRKFVFERHKSVVNAAHIVYQKGCRGSSTGDFMKHET